MYAFILKELQIVGKEGRDIELSDSFVHFPSDHSGHAV